MTWNARRCALACVVCGLVISGSYRTAAAATTKWGWTEETGKSIGLVFEEKPVWTFHYAPHDGKPYFDPVSLPGGADLTWNQPPDHPWHHGLWFSWKYLNRVNYWEMNPKTKKPDGQTRWSDVTIRRGERFSADIGLDVEYVDPKGAVVLSERRDIQITAPDPTGQYHFDWTSRFTAGGQDVVLDRTPLPNQPNGKGYGGYAGLSLRLTQRWQDRESTTLDGLVEFNASSRYRGKSPALDYHGILEGRKCGIAICDHPDNLNYPTPWYVIRTNVMSYFTPAVICYGPHTLESGQSMTLRYRILVHPGTWDKTKLKHESTSFVRQSSNR